MRSLRSVHTGLGLDPDHMVKNHSSPSKSPVSSANEADTDQSLRRLPRAPVYMDGCGEFGGSKSASEPAGRARAGGKRSTGH